MLQVVLIILCAASLAVVHRKKIEDFLAPVLMSGMLFIYCGGVLGQSLRMFSYLAMGIMVAVTIGGAVYTVGFGIKRQSNDIAGLRSESFRVSFFKSFRGYVFTPAFIICIVTCLVFGVIFSSHRLMHWDDLSYWGIYLKDIFCLDRLPLGVENCTISYKDYPPIQQIMEYFFMFTGDGFNEPIAFCVNVCFLYVIMLPFLSGFGRTKSYLGKIVTVIMYVIFPHIFTTQFYYKLGLDFLISVLFGYGIYLIVREYDDVGTNMTSSVKCHAGGNKVFRNENRILTNRNEIYRLLGIVVVSSYLAIIKTSGVVLSLFLTVFYAIRIITEYSICKNSDVPMGKADCDHTSKSPSSHNQKSCARGFAIFVRALILSGFVPICAYSTWKLWGRRTGNHGYLSDIVSSNVKSFAIEFPPYTGEVTLNYIKHVLTYPLTREKVGVTAFAMIVIIAVMYYVRKRNIYTAIKNGAENDCNEDKCVAEGKCDAEGKCNAEGKYVDEGKCDEDAFTLRKKERVLRNLHITMCVGTFIFCVAHLYMYLFVFDDWEAHGLLEFDRYINQYLAGILFVYTYDMWNDLSRRRVAGLSPAIILTAFFAAMLPYSSVGDYLIPSHYDALYDKSYEPTRLEASSEWDACTLRTLNLPLDEDHRVMLVGNAWTDEFQFFTLEMVPQAVTVATNAPALAQGEICDFIADQIVSRGIEYIYVMNNADADYPGDIAAESIEKFGVALECGQSYYVDRSDDEMTFVKL